MTETTAKEGSTEDWLGYGAYADALWGRIQTALNKSEGSNAVLGDDPLVIGVFGEWGAGKSKLLSLMQDRSRIRANERIGWRKRDGGNFGLTVPVYFQPWKYEHEEHLHVPLLLHIFAALKQELLAAQTWGEWAGGKVPEGITKHMDAVVALFGLCLTGAAVALDTALPLISRFGLAGAGLLGKVLPKINRKPVGNNPAEVLQHADSGRYFYEIHEALKAVTRPRQHGKYLQGVKLSADVPINFVIFIDDLDRCLPEKAVQTLELIKTIFNAESFAFVLALDDEVIERGIGHRYKDYQLVGRKPEMPITGFEYLEKIIHLPFRLPALTREQAAAFVRKYESDIEPDAALRWFDKPVAVEATRPEYRISGPGQPHPGRTVQATDLLELALDGFDAFMPRKLIRLVELLHQVAAIARLQQKPLQMTYAGEVDVRVVLVSLLIQLFQPELFRVLRRDPGRFPALLAAFSVREVGVSADLPLAKMADIDLWRWAVNPKDPNFEWRLPRTESPYNHAVNCISKAYKDNASDRRSAQQMRLPIVVQLVEHRTAQRHVFDVLRLTRRLAEEMTKTGSAPEGLTFEPYLSFLAQSILLASSATAKSELSGNITLDGVIVSGAINSEASGKLAPQTAPTFSVSNVEELAQLLVSPETEAQANMASRLELRAGHVLDDGSAKNLVSALNAKLNGGTADASQTNKVRTLNGLQYLAPFLSRAQARAMWQLVADCVDLQTELNPQHRALWGDVRAKLGCDPRFEENGLRLAKKDIEDHPTAFSTRGQDIPGFARIDAPNKPFYMAQTLATVEQYRAFVDSDDYVRCFQGAGAAWLKGDYEVENDNTYWKTKLAVRPSDQRLQPFMWPEQLKNPLHPVVNVSWFEAQAYVRWLQSKLPVFSYGNWIASLPTELQWECAARYGSTDAEEPRPYPWTGEPRYATADAKEFVQHANLSSLVGGLTTVGIYPKGHAPKGLADMAGNAREWMANSYYDQSNPSRVGPNQKFDDLIASRGGSFVDNSSYALCSSSELFPAYGWSNVIGFRVVLSQPD